MLKPGGRLIVAVDHPFATVLAAVMDGRKAGYFGITQRTEEWNFGDRAAMMSFWHRPLHAISEAFTTAGFRISVISEPEPAPEARELFPDDIADKPRFLCFLFFVLHAD
ncbi:MAG: hypothetical protein ACRDN0_12355 [Trebonia sp.]